MQCKLRGIRRVSAYGAVGLMAALALSGCKEQLQSRVTEHDANEILATLYSARIHASKSPVDEETWAVEVDARDLQLALQVMREHGLPREQFSDTGELFKKEGLVSTPSEERIRFIYAISQELSHTLSQIDGVVSARVHPVIPANDPLASQIRPASASVFIKHRRDANLQAMAPAIKNLVMRGIEGLAYENISLTFVVAEEPAWDIETAAPARAGDFAQLIVIGVLGALLLGALGGLGYLWTRYRKLAAQDLAGSEEMAAADDVRSPRRAGAWFALLSPWRRAQRTDRNSQRTDPHVAPSPRDAPSSAGPAPARQAG